MGQLCSTLAFYWSRHPSLLCLRTLRIHSPHIPRTTGIWYERCKVHWSTTRNSPWNDWARIARLLWQSTVVQRRKWLPDISRGHQNLPNTARCHTGLSFDIRWHANDKANGWILPGSVELPRHFAHQFRIHQHFVPVVLRYMVDCFKDRDNDSFTTAAFKNLLLHANHNEFQLHRHHDHQCHQRFARLHDLLRHSHPHVLHDFRHFQSKWCQRVHLTQSLRPQSANDTASLARRLWPWILFDRKWPSSLRWRAHTFLDRLGHHGPILCLDIPEFHYCRSK